MYSKTSYLKKNFTRKILHYEKVLINDFVKTQRQGFQKKNKKLKGHARSIKAGCKTNFLMRIKKNPWTLPSCLKKFLFVCFQIINFKLDFYIPIRFGLLNTPFYLEFYIHFLFPFLISILYPFSIWTIIFYWTLLFSFNDFSYSRSRSYMYMIFNHGIENL